MFEWQEKARNGEAPCAKCGRKDHITVDHIIPYSFLLDLGMRKEDLYEDEKNFQFLCRWCNVQKANRLDHLNPKTIPLLKGYVEQYERELTLMN